LINIVAEIKHNLMAVMRIVRQRKSVEGDCEGNNTKAEEKSVVQREEFGQRLTLITSVGKGGSV
jgi:hypothetical protein